MDEKTLKRFNAKINRLPEPGCWLWLASKDPKGYGRFGLDGHWGRAHRVAYDLWRGPIPDGLWVLHECDTPNCVNPAHLFLGTHQDNMDDKVAKGRQVRLCGSRNPSTHLTEADVVDIRRVYAAGGVSYTDLGRQYSVDRSSIGYIVQRKTWGHVA